MFQVYRFATDCGYVDVVASSYSRARHWATRYDTRLASRVPVYVRRAVFMVAVWELARQAAALNATNLYACLESEPCEPCWQ